MCSWRRGYCWFRGCPRLFQALGLAGVVAFCAVALADEQLTVLKCYPVIINLGAAGYFWYTLVNPPSAIARLSRAIGMQVEGPAVPYTHRLTAVWVVFFLVSAAVAAYTALFGSMGVWAWYNGLVSYLLIGLLILGEYPVRLIYRRRHGIE